jgi:hypothetical protein
MVCTRLNSPEIAGQEKEEELLYQIEGLWTCRAGSPTEEHLITTEGNFLIC